MGCCGSPSDIVMSGLAGACGASSSASRANGERSLSLVASDCAGLDAADRAIDDAKTSCKADSSGGHRAGRYGITPA